MANRQQVKRNAIRTVHFCTVKNDKGFTYVELLVTFSLTMFMVASILTVSGQMFEQREQNADRVVLQREASALQFLMLNEMKQGYNFHVINGNLIFQLSSSEAVRLEKNGYNFARRISTRGVRGPFDGYILLSRYVDEVVFQPDADRLGVEISIVFKKGDATLTQRTYWRSRIERGGD